MTENPDLQYTLNLNEINAIIGAIQELPAKIANPLTMKIREQAEKQIRAIQEAEAAEIRVAEEQLEPLE